MSQEDFISVTNRFRVDTKFVGELLRDFERAIRENGFSLSKDEINRAKAAFEAANAPIAAKDGYPPVDSQQQLPPAAGVHLEQLRSAQIRRTIELGEYTVNNLKGTLNSAKFTYQLITVMNGVMFSMGVGLFLFAAAYGAVSGSLKLTAAFAGLGAASFVTLFMLGPIDKTQDALSNLIQAEVAFMNYFEQITFLEGFAQIPTPGSGLLSTDHIEKASSLLQRRTEETIVLLQTYLETRPTADSKSVRTASNRFKGTPSSGTRSRSEISEPMQPLEDARTR